MEREDPGKALKALLPAAVKRLKKWDLKAIKGIDYFVAISGIVKDRIKKYYGRDYEKGRNLRK